MGFNNYELAASGLADPTESGKRVPIKDVLLVRVADATGSVVREVATAVKERCPDTLVLVTDGEADIESLDEDEMREHGWVRA